MGDEESSLWGPFDVAVVLELLSDSDVLWWLSGGQALDVFLQRSSSALTATSTSACDGPIGQRCNAFLRHRLDVKIAHNGVLSDATDGPLDNEVNGFWARDVSGGPWRLQINLELVDDTDWVYRRDLRIRRPLREVVWWRGPLPYVNPAVQLLWKATDPGPKDELNHTAVMPLLSGAERQWLADVISLTCPSSPWAPGIREADES